MNKTWRYFWLAQACGVIYVALSQELGWFCGIVLGMALAVAVVRAWQWGVIG